MTVLYRQVSQVPSKYPLFLFPSPKTPVLEKDMTKSLRSLKIALNPDKMSDNNHQWSYWDSQIRKFQALAFSWVYRTADSLNLCLELQEAFDALSQSEEERITWPEFLAAVIRRQSSDDAPPKQYQSTSENQVGLKWLKSYYSIHVFIYVYLIANVAKHIMWIQVLLLRSPCVEQCLSTYFFDI